MIRLISFVVAVGLAIAAAVWMADHPGEVIIQWLGWRLDSSVPVLLVVFAVVGALGLVGFRFALQLATLPSLFSRFRSRRAQRKGLAALSQALSALLAEDYPLAIRLARQAQGQLIDPSPAVVVLARAAVLSADYEVARPLLETLAGNKGTALAALRGLIDIARAEQNISDLATYAARAVDRAPRRSKTGWAVRALAEAQVRSDLLEAAQKTLDAGHRRKSLDEAEYNRLSAGLYCRRSEQAGAAGQTYEASRLARKAVLADMQFLPALLCHAAALKAEGSLKKAAKALEDAWKQQPHAAIAEAYFSLWPEDNALARAQRAETLADQLPEHPESRLLAARYALEARLWGSARSRLKPLLDKAGQDPRIGLLLARIEEEENGNKELAARWLHQAALAAARPSVAGVAVTGSVASGSEAGGWHCQSCAATPVQWTLVCPSCQQVGEIVPAA